MLKKSILLITSLLALSFIACSSTSIQKEEINKPNATLENTYWKAISFYDTDVKTVAKEAHIKFNEKGSINGNLGCNNFFGTYKIENDTISFSKVGSTRMMCQDMSTEDSFSKVFQDAKKYEIKGETLNFFDDKNINISTFKAVYF